MIPFTSDELAQAELEGKSPWQVRYGDDPLAVLDNHEPLRMLKQDLERALRDYRGPYGLVPPAGDLLEELAAVLLRRR